MLTKIHHIKINHIWTQIILSVWRVSSQSGLYPFRSIWDLSCWNIKKIKFVILLIISLERYYFVLYDGALTLKMLKIVLNPFCNKTSYLKTEWFAWVKMQKNVVVSQEVIFQKSQKLLASPGGHVSLGPVHHPRQSLSEKHPKQGWSLEQFWHPIPGNHWTSLISFSFSFVIFSCVWYP